jgi:hypothetical protein
LIPKTPPTRNLTGREVCSAHVVNAVTSGHCGSDHRLDALNAFSVHQEVILSIDAKRHKDLSSRSRISSPLFKKPVEGARGDY